jgi:hypothetical protein
VSTFSLTILSEKLINFSVGQIYLIQSKNEFEKEDLISSTDALYLNYPFDEAKKIIPSFEKLSSKKQKEIVTFIQEVYGYKLRVDDLTGKLVVMLLLNLGMYDLLIVGLVGLGNNAIDFVFEIANKMISMNKGKTIIFTEISPDLSEPFNVRQAVSR